MWRIEWMMPVSMIIPPLILHSQTPSINLSILVNYPLKSERIFFKYFDISVVYCGGIVYNFLCRFSNSGFSTQSLWFQNMNIWLPKLISSHYWWRKKMNKVLYIILIFLFSLTVISCAKKDDSSSSPSISSSSSSGINAWLLEGRWIVQNKQSISQPIFISTNVMDGEVYVEFEWLIWIGDLFY